jgi:hypothetical protein
VHIIRLLVIKHEKKNMQFTLTLQVASNGVAIAPVQDAIDLLFHILRIGQVLVDILISKCAPLGEGRTEVQLAEEEAEGR